VPAVAVATGYSTYEKVSSDVANGDPITKIVEDSLTNLAIQGLMLTPAYIESLAEKIIAEEGVEAVEAELDNATKWAALDKALSAYGFFTDLRDLLRKDSDSPCLTSKAQTP
jgi:hypothetical protein